jgi:homeobox protein YOX1/YHP1
LPLSHLHLSLAPPPTSSFPNYETDDRYPHEAQYTYYPPSRSPPPISGNPPEPRKLPRLTTTAGAGWHTPSHMPASSNYTTTGSYIRSPTATYHPEYDYQASSQGHGYSYQDVHDYDDHHHVPSMNPQGHMTTAYEGSHHHSHHHHHHRPSSPPIKGSPQVPLPSISPTDESTVKKKRKRADAAQLKVLNETYNRTAFPSTEERLELAKALDMSPRSVQIWCILLTYYISMYIF